VRISLKTLENIALQIGINIIVTLVVSILLAYVLVFIFQRLTSQVKLFLVIAVLMLLYAFGKKLHLSSLLIILAFGLVLNNVKLFFRGKTIGKLVNEDAVKPILHDFHILTLESAFVIRTFFFVIFGMFITISSILDYHVALISIAMIGALYAVRFLVLKIVVRRDITPQLYLAPRGLITILLFFVVTSRPEFEIPNFNPGILLFVILISSLIMTVALITHRGENVREVLLGQLPKIKTDRNKNNIDDEYEDRVNDNVEKQDYNQF
jgi:cell volume regulation protein A